MAKEMSKSRKENYEKMIAGSREYRERVKNGEVKYGKFKSKAVQDRLKQLVDEGVGQVEIAKILGNEFDFNYTNQQVGKQVRKYLEQKNEIAKEVIKEQMLDGMPDTVRIMADSIIELRNKLLNGKELTTREDLGIREEMRKEIECMFKYCGLGIKKDNQTINITITDTQEGEE